MKDNKKGILSFIVGFAVMLFSGVFYAWSLFRVELQAQFPTWTASAVSLNLSIFIITFCLGSLLGGRLTARLGQRKVTRLGAILVLIGGAVFLLIGGMEASGALVLLYLSYGGLCGVGVGMIYNADLSAVNGCFPKAGGLVSGALLTGFGLGSLVMGAAVTAVAKITGFYPAFFLSVLLVAVTAFFGAPVMCGGVRKTEDAPAAAPGEGMSTGEMLRSPIFWLFFLWVLFTTSGGLMVINSSASIATLFGAAAIVGMIVSVFNGLSRTFIGAFCDKKGSSASMLVTNVVAVLAGGFLLAAYHLGSTWLMVGGLITVGITYGCAMSMNATVIREQFGTRCYASNLSVATLSGIPASIIGPYVSGLLQDASGGDYRTTFVAVLVFSLVAGVMLTGILLLRKRAK